MSWRLLPGLVAILCALALGAPAQAAACLLVGRGAGLRVTGLRAVIALAQEDDLTLHAHLQVAYAGAERGEPLGLVLPVPPGGAVLTSERAEKAALEELSALTEATDPMVIPPMPSCGGCGPAVLAPPSPTGAERWDSSEFGPYAYLHVRRIEDVDAWAERWGFELSFALREAARSQLRGGGEVLLVAKEQVYDASGAFRPIEVSAEGAAATVPLSWAAGCLASPAELLVFLTAQTGVEVSGPYASRRLDTLDPQLFASGPVTEPVYLELNRKEGRAVLVTELSLPFAELSDRAFFVDETGASLPTVAHGRPWLTRVHGYVDSETAAGDPLFEPSAGVPRVSGIIDQRSDLRAHGATIASGPSGQALLVLLILALFRRHRR
ncbi:MAG: DUF2330 domain-containing protein [Deltaproteobacteria bacterium]|nr:MAG: DUF2330 domain-containing protein [Deltaproteobacteria bacterium]